MDKSLKTWLADLIKWVLIIIIAALVFYMVYPKYYFVGTSIRCNKVTGRVEHWSYVESNWKAKGKK